MSNKRIIVEQTLHGYSQGHHLLASSKEMSDNSLRIMSILSDLSGPEVYKGFSEYITGYPLINDNYYALGKTWYAPEMERPGCVWTHTLLFRFEDLVKLRDCGSIMELFIRPQKCLDKRIYVDPYSIDYCKDLPKLANISVDALKYLVWSIYESSHPIILTSKAANEYLEEILIIWQNQSLNLRKTFTFCTGALANRRINKQAFDFQIVPYALAKSISRSSPEAIVIDTSSPSSSEKYPKWVDSISNELFYQSKGEINEFVENFGSAFNGREYIGKFAQLYFETNATNGIKNIGNFFIKAKEIFQTIDYNKIVFNTVSQLFDFKPNKWFNQSQLFIQELSTAININDDHVKVFQFKDKLELLFTNKYNIAKDLFKGLILMNLNQFGHTLLKELSLFVKPMELVEFTDMDLNACSVLVTFNSEFALCIEIWQQSLNFQCEIIDCIDVKNLSCDLTLGIIEVILENSKEDLSNQVFRAFGTNSINIFLNWYLKPGEQKNEKKKTWMKICAYSPEDCIRWVLNIKALDDVDLIVSIVSALDPYSENVRQLGVEPWLKVFDKLNSEEIDEGPRLVLAQFFLPLILLSNEKVTDEFVEFSFYPMHAKLEEQHFDYNQWQKLDKLLPTLSRNNNWDKCKRLRRAMKRKGYLFLK